MNQLTQRLVVPVSSRLAEPPGPALASNLRAFRFLLLLHVAVQSWGYVVVPIRAAHLAFPPVGAVIVASLLTLCAFSSLTRFGRFAPILALPPLLIRLSWSGLWIPNHTFLVFFCVLLTAVLDPDRDDESVLLLQSLRWLTAMVLFYTGLQKVMHGLWFRGEFLTWMVGRGNDNWRWVFGWLVPEEEVQRLFGLGYGPDTGPYRVQSTALLLLSNLTYVAEMALPVLLVIRRTRVAATLVAILFVFTIQLAPREFMFVLCFTNLLILFLPVGWNRRLAPLIALGYLYLLAAALRPDWFGDFALKAAGRI